MNGPSLLLSKQKKEIAIVWQLSSGEKQHQLASCEKPKATVVLLLSIEIL
jgi:hypothetical protein